MITKVICSVLIRAFGMMPSEFTRIQLFFLTGRRSIFRLDVVSSGRACSLMQFSFELIRIRSNEWSNAWSNEWCFCSIDFELNNRRPENRAAAAAAVLSIGDELKLSLKLANVSLYLSLLFGLSASLEAIKPSGHMLDWVIEFNFKLKRSRNLANSGLIAWIFDCCSPAADWSQSDSLPVDWSFAFSSRSFDAFRSVKFGGWSVAFKNCSVAADNWSLPSSCSLLKKSSSLLANGAAAAVSLTHRSLVTCSVRRWSNQMVRIIQQ